MEKMKTVKEWLQTLPEPLKSSALKQASEVELYNKYGCLSDAILFFTPWDTTKEGRIYWDKLHDFLYEFEQLDNN